MEQKHINCATLLGVALTAFGLSLLNVPPISKVAFIIATLIFLIVAITEFFTKKP